MLHQSNSVKKKQLNDRNVPVFFLPPSDFTHLFRTIEEQRYSDRFLSFTTTEFLNQVEKLRCAVEIVLFNIKAWPLKKQNPQKTPFYKGSKNVT